MQVWRALGKQRLAHGACARGIPAAGGGAGGEQSAQAQVSSSKSSGPGQKAAHGGTAALQELGVYGKFKHKVFFVLCCVRWMVV